ncbi:MAG: heme NO-binding domain-containing protein [Bacteroidota bacterium]
MVFYLLFTHRKNMIKLAGNPLNEFLSSLKVLHHSVNYILPDLLYTRFSARHETENSIELEHSSRSEGPYPKVTDLLRRLWKKFEKENYTISHIAIKKGHGECEVFNIK